MAKKTSIKDREAFVAEFRKALKAHYPQEDKRCIGITAFCEDAAEKGALMPYGSTLLTSVLWNKSLNVHRLALMVQATGLPFDINSHIEGNEGSVQ